MSFSICDVLGESVEGRVRLSSLLQVLLDRSTNSYVIGGLRPGSEYEVLLAATYSDEVESDEVVLLESTGSSASDCTFLGWSPSSS